MPRYDNADISRITDAPREGVICFDTETTGLDAGGRDEILQLSIVDGTGAALFSDYVRPEHRQRWPKAQEVNGITPAMVRDKRTISELLPELDEIFSRARVLVAYNLEFDLSFLEAAGVRVPTCAQFDVMKEFAPVAGKWDERHGDLRWVKLGQCAGHYGYRFDAHDALEDARATLHCFDAMLSDDAPGGYLSLVEGGRRRQEESARRRKEYEAKRKAEEERRERKRYERGAEGTLGRLQREENARREGPHLGRGQTREQGGVHRPGDPPRMDGGARVLRGEDRPRRPQRRLLLDARPLGRRHSPGGQDGARRGGARRLSHHLEEAESPMRKERP